MKISNLIYSILFLFFIACDDNNQNQQIDPDLNFYPTSTTNSTVQHKYYMLSYNENHEQAEWVAYELKNEHIVYTTIKRPYFEQDPNVTTGSADWRNFKDSGYTKGHLLPAADRKFSKEAYNETFLTSNVSPQIYDFNAGVWQRLEEKTRYWAQKYDQLYVITGGILSDELKTIGYEEVSVPKYFYKILLDYTKPEIKAIAFLIPHEESDKPLYEFVISIDKLESLTGIDFYPALPDDLEGKLESSSDYKGWSFR
ncbi:MAG: DNA/RNA non-specific endonuclease [Bacteroidota bacterium]